MTKLKSIILGVTLMLIAAVTVGCTMSAYDVAVQNGFEGTEQQWLDSLSGKDGADGRDITADALYQKAKDEGFTGTYLDFVKEYLTISEAADNSDAITKGLRSAMIIYCQFSGSTNTLFGSPRTFAQAGAGVIYRLNKSEGSAYIVTNYHVVYSSESSTSNKISDDITVTPFGGEEIAATYVGGSSQYDIAVLSVKDDYFKTEIPQAVTVASSNDIIVGQTVIAIGNPAGFGLSATEGIISVDSEEISMSGIENPNSPVTMRVMRVDAAVNSGNSGGGLFDASGNLIGIVNAKSADTSIENMGYAIPSVIATAVADKIIENGKFVKGALGVTVTSDAAQAYLDGGKIRVRETVKIASVDGAAKNILQNDDIVLSIKVGDGAEVEATRRFTVVDLMLTSMPGDKITLKIRRGEEEKTVEVICN